MPVEKIQPANWVGEAEPTFVRVGWMRDAESVQIATIEPESKFTWDMVDKEATSEQRFDGWYVSLGRIEINRLIRALRRARDAAYGKDE